MDIYNLRPVSFISKIVSTTKERLDTHMPKTYDHNNWQNRGNVKIELIRKFPVLKKFRHYHVGDKVKFELHFDKPNPKEYSDSHGKHAVYEQFGDNKPERLAFIDEIKQTVEGHTIAVETSVAYRIGSSFDDSQNKAVVFTTTVESWDTVRTKWAWSIIGAILSLIVGLLLWLLGIIQIDPTWVARFNP